MRRIQLLGPIGLTLGMICVLACGGTVRAQNPIRPGFGAQLVVDPDRDVVQALAEAKQSIAKKQYHSAVQLLQFVLDRPEDSFLERDFQEERGNRGGTRKEALRLLMSLSADGHAAYELEYGATAKQLLATAMEFDDFGGVAEVARRFTATSAGYDATIFLAAVASDGNRPLEAALLLEPLRTHPKRTPQFSLQRAVYWSRAGRLARGVAALRELKRSDPTGKIRLKGRDVPLPANDDDAAKLLGVLALRDVDAASSQVTTWSMPGGAPTRNASAAPASPVGGNIWRVSTLEHMVLDGRPDEDRRQRARFREALDRVLVTLLEENRPALPAVQPLVIGDTVVYRTLGDITAVSLQSGELLWRSSVVDESLVRFLNVRAADARSRMGRSVSLHAATLEGHLERRAFRDIAAGTLTSDGRTVFALEELDGNANVTVNVFGASESRPANKLAAYDLTGGRLLWEVGGPRGSKPVELSSLYFLGPPAPVNDRLYVIAENQGALQLLVLEQDADRQSVRIDWLQTLIATDPPLMGQPLRRLSGLSPSTSDGIMVCPTSSGAVVALDVARRVLVWGFQYPSFVRPDSQNAAPVFDRVMQQEFRLEEADKLGRWMDSTPLIVDGKVLITPRDSDRLYCLDLVDGHELWQLPRDEWMYVACVVEGRVVLVGRHGVGAVQLDDGKAMDSFAAAEVEPTGRGVRVGHFYCLPTAAGEIATIDLRNGGVLARSKLTGGLIPGNLAAGNGAIVSQSAGDLTGFSQLAAIEQQITRLTTDPRDAAGLALRGELRLHRGEEAAGLSDLRESLQRKPDPHVKSVLATALLAAVRADPKRIGGHVAELESITDDPQQKNEFLRLYSKSLEAAGDRRGAFAQLIRLAGTAQFLDSLRPVETGYSVRTDRSVRARLNEMYSAAPAEERVELDRALEQHIHATAATLGQGEHLERCLRFFGGLSKADAILLQSVMKIKEGITAQRRLELLRPFLRSGDVAVAARATALRCAELIKSEQWSAAVPLIRQLRLEYADRECLDGKSGRSLADEWSAREEVRRLMTAPVVWREGPIDVTRGMREPGAQRTTVPAEIVSRSGTLLAGWSFETDPAGTLLMARDASGVLRWKLPLPVDGEFSDPDLRSVPVSCQVHVRDNWLAVSRVTYFVVIDVSSAPSPRVVWQQLLKPAGISAANFQQQMRVRVNGRITTRPSGSFGQVIGVTRETVIYTVGTKLLAGDLETGRLAWSRQEPGFSQVDASADDRVIAITGKVGGQEVQLLRTLDGARIAKRSAQPLSLWTRGARQLVRRASAPKMVFELLDLERDAVVWRHECSADTQVTVVDDEDVAFLEPNGQLLMARLSDKRERYRAQLPLKLGALAQSWVAVQRSAGRDIILAGESYRHRATQIVPFDLASTQMATAFDGQVCAVSSIDGRVLWTRSVEKAAFDRTQPAGLPVLLLASRQIDGRNAGNPFLQRFRMTATIIDKQTGNEVYSTDETAPSQAPRFEPDPERGRIVVNFHEWQLELKFPDADKVNPAK